ncbi:polysaccharide lyase 8 family protein [Microbacterium sp. KUDC0406]|uniref:polysaccharide lyase 8 family protein n=1 Tax=Microbacterium sp. KUDC0406 TaxID=2909588 RepID=UPI001F1660E6|nr:polysaccharide lyase 8 family protein [Microbacterium sp. KUDC0406]UJP08781.1 polysaccharide lyase 8 family protein [Microbacterium sp. KUDC0406]
MSLELPRRSFLTLLGAGALVAVSTQPAAASTRSAFSATAEDPLAALIQRRRIMLVGDGSAASVPELAEALSQMSAEAQTVWDSMVRPVAAPGIWADVPITGVTGTTLSGNMGLTFDRMFSLALAYSTAGCAQYGDTALASDLVAALTFISANVYVAGKSPVGNWWFWEIGVPRKAADILVLLHEAVPADVRTALMAAARYFTPNPNWRGRGTGSAETGANRTDKALSCMLRGALDGRPDEIALARDALSDTVGAGRNSVFGYVTSGDGFYTDGSFVQHTYLPYVGTYGVVTLGGIAEILGLLGGSEWDVTDPKKAVVLDAVEAAYAPFIWNGRMMDAVRGRAVSRQKAPDYVDGAAALTAILLLAPGAGEPYRTRYLSLVKGWLQRCTDQTLYGLPTQTVAKSLLVTSVLGDDAIEPAPAPVYTKAFGDQDRLVHHRPAFSAVANISSKRIGRYEWGNKENNLGWYQGDGLTFVYTPADPGQFSADFWPTVDPYRLPGTTVTAEPHANGAADGTGIPRAFQAFAGGLELDGRWGIQGMDHLNHNRTLSARKSWFFLDDGIVCLGAAIAGTTDHEVFTTVENRSFAAGRLPAITADGARRTLAPGDAAVAATKAVHIAGHGGYVFLEGENVSGSVDVQAVRRTGDWQTINSGADTGGDAEPRTRDYLTITHRHGAKPDSGGYAYLILPGADEGTTSAQSQTPSVTVLANDEAAQVVADGGNGLTLANFFAASPAGAAPSHGITVSGPCSVAAHRDGDLLAVALSDPSRTQTSARVTFADVQAVAAGEADDGVTVVSTSPLTLQFALDGHGHSARIEIDCGAPVTLQVTPRSLAGKVHLYVSAENRCDRPVTITLATAYGEKTFTGIHPGHSATTAFATRAASIGAGVVTAAVAGFADVEQSYPAL